MPRVFGNIVKISLTVLFFICYTNCIAQINVSSTQTAQALSRKLAGQGVTILNPTLNCPSVANGFFSAANSNLGLDSGIVLTNGRAATNGSTFGVNGAASYLASNDNSAPGDSQLNALAGISTLDACDLEFDIIPFGDTVKFDYVFSSEEYINSVCGPYNDAFAFFISGPGITGYEDMALVPGTTIPVTINSINDGIPGSLGSLSICTAMGPGSPFTSYYINNSSGQTLTHNGLTTVMQAIHAVTPCDTFHLKIVIADAGDPLYDSGVFLKAGSLQTSSYNITAVTPPSSDSDLAYCIKGCLPGKFVVKRTQAGSQPQTLKLVAGGTAITGLDYGPIPDSVTIPANDSQVNLTITGLPTPINGNRILKLYIVSPFVCSGSNNIIDSASMVIYDSLYLNLGTGDTSICLPGSVQLSVTGSRLLSYTWWPATGLTEPGISNPVASPLVNTTYVVTGNVPGTLCAGKSAGITISIKLTPVATTRADTIVCIDRTAQLNATTSFSNLYYSYLWQGPSGFTATGINPVIENVDAATEGIYTLTITIDTNGCTENVFSQVSAYMPDTPVFNSPVIFCVGSQFPVINIEGKDIQWYNAPGDSVSIPMPVVSTAIQAEYQYFVSQTLGHCESRKVPYSIDVLKCCDGNIFIPTAFSPNGDGKNDKFIVFTDYGYFIKNMEVFNRWGQMVYSGEAGIWDGKFEGTNCEIGTYFYYIKFGCINGSGVERKGDVILVR